jgi:glycosyltransferase involved in cell wall biosynthesis
MPETAALMHDGLLHVLTLTPFYPVEGDDARGCFVAEPMDAVSSLDVRHTILVGQPFYRGGGKPDESSRPARQIRYFSLPGGIGLPSSGLMLFARLVGDVGRIHASNPIHLIHSHSALPCGHAAALLSRELHIPFVVTVHGLDAYSTRQVKGISGEWCKRISRLVYRSACRTICVSQKVADRVAAGATTPVRTVVVYNGVDPNLFFPAENIAEPMQVLAVGDLIPIKGHEILLRAFACVRQRFPECTCEIVGDGPERRRLQDLVRMLGIESNVRFLGRLPRAEVSVAMRRCTIFALPSRYEALGCVYLEAMASGKTVVACRGQGIEEVIRDGENGVLVASDDISQLSNALGLLLADRQVRERMGKAARETILAGFTVSQQALWLRQIYEECAQ